MQATDNVLKQTHLLSSQEDVNPYLSAMGALSAEYSQLCAEISAGSQRWIDATMHGDADEVAYTSTPPLNPYDDPD